MEYNLDKSKWDDLKNKNQKSFHNMGNMEESNSFTTSKTLKEHFIMNIGHIEKNLDINPDDIDLNEKNFDTKILKSYISGSNEIVSGEFEYNNGNNDIEIIDDKLIINKNDDNINFISTIQKKLNDSINGIFNLNENLTTMSTTSTTTTNSNANNLLLDNYFYNNINNNSSSFIDINNFLNNFNNNNNSNTNINNDLIGENTSNNNNNIYFINFNKNISTNSTILFNNNSGYNFTDFELLYRHSMTMTIVYCIAYILVFIIGLVGNSFVIAVVLRAPRMRTVTNFFIVNLAIADILVIVFCLPATLMGNIFVPWVLGWLMCKTVPYIQGVSVAASVYSLIAVSLDRFIAIWWPLKQMTKRRARLMIFCIWIIALSSTIPWALFFDLVPAAESIPAGILVCVEVWPPGTDGNLYFLLANLLTCYLLPMALITLCYVLIWIKVSTRSIPGDSKDAQMDRMQQKSKIKVVKMLVVVVILFVISWLPLYVIFARIKFGGEITQEEGEILSTLTPMAQWLGSSNSCINPILYAFFNKKYRKGFAAIIKSRTCCGRLRYYDNVAIASSSTSTRKSSRYQNGTMKGPNSPSTKNVNGPVSFIYEHNSVRKHNLIVKQDSNLSQQMLLKQDSHGSRHTLVKQESASSDASRRLLLKQDSSGSRNSLLKQDSVISYIETRRGQLIRQDSDLSKKCDSFSTQDTISIDSRRDILCKQDNQIANIEGSGPSGFSNNRFSNYSNSTKNSFSSQDSCSSLLEHKRHRLVKQDSIISFADQKPEPKRHQLVKQDSVISFADQKPRGFLNKQESVIGSRENGTGHHVSILKKTDSQSSTNSSPRRNIEFAE